ncbi:hypothetical protein NDU88_003501 [Pleurodeles waltl]|uniref:Uncharacterized protein n=1 Tax=Pleurodeles waltl TaxID=8319 RepID=A0AAV7ME03_PLEWA|nr:hypothetical protein NDU88_003501 [Pleurodeles waltl]
MNRYPADSLAPPFLLRVEPACSTTMSSQRNAKKNTTLKDIRQTLVKETRPEWGDPFTCTTAGRYGCSRLPESPVMRTFLENPFGTHRDDKAALKQDIAVDMKDI